MKIRSKLTCLIFIPTAIIMMAACAHAAPERTEKLGSKYTFRKIQNYSIADTKQIASLQLPSFEEVTKLVNSGHWPEYMASFRGSLISLFGEPQEVSYLLDEAYTYFIEATDQNSNNWILVVAQTGSGPTIIGDIHDPSNIPAAEALLNLIEITRPADFEATIYDEDTNHTVTYGCKGGSCYWNEVTGNHIP